MKVRTGGCGIWEAMGQKVTIGYGRETCLMKDCIYYNEKLLTRNIIEAVALIIRRTSHESTCL